MKQLSLDELLCLKGGASVDQNCMWLLQYEANTHVNSGDEDAEEKYWKKWAERFENCANSGVFT